jgi:hypothetical protein
MTIIEEGRCRSVQQDLHGKLRRGDRLTGDTEPGQAVTLVRPEVFTPVNADIALEKFGITKVKPVTGK